MCAHSNYKAQNRALIIVAMPRCCRNGPAADAQTSLVLAVTMCWAMSVRSRLQAKPTLMAVSCTGPRFLRPLDAWDMRLALHCHNSFAHALIRSGVTLCVTERKRSCDSSVSMAPACRQ